MAYFSANEIEKCPVGRISHIIQLKHEAPHVENPGDPLKTLSRECRTPWMPNCAREKTGQNSTSESLQESETHEKCTCSLHSIKYRFTC